jgi:hypothetical protein
MARWWLWPFTNADLNLCEGAHTLGSGVPLQAFGEDFLGTVIADFYSAYSRLPGLTQKCLAHFF